MATYYLTTIRRPDGYEFNNRHETREAMLEWMAVALQVLLPGETLSYVVVTE